MKQAKDHSSVFPWNISPTTNHKSGHSQSNVTTQRFSTLGHNHPNKGI